MECCFLTPCLEYQELLALEEHIGDVNTGLTEETIIETMQQTKYHSIMEGSPSNLEPCCICRVRSIISIYFRVKFLCIEKDKYFWVGLQRGEMKRNLVISNVLFDNLVSGPMDRLLRGINPPSSRGPIQVEAKLCMDSPNTGLLV